MRAEKLPADEIDRINDALSGLPHSFEFVPGDLPTVAEPKPGATFLEVYAHERATLDMFGEVIERLWAAPRTKEEMKARKNAIIDSQAKIPNMGGLLRGNSTDHRGNPRVATPMATIGWPRQSHGFWLTPSGGKLLETQNALPTLLWLFGDEIKAKLDSVIDEKYSDDDAISAADKPAMIAKAETDLWNQRRVVEETYLAATAAGFKVKRPRETSIEILLGLEKFGTKPAQPKANDADHATGADPEFG